MSARTLNVSGQLETEKLIEYVNQLGLKRAAEKYGTNASSLSRWLRSQGYQLRRTYVLTLRGKQTVTEEEFKAKLYAAYPDVENAR